MKIEICSLRDLEKSKIKVYEKYLIVKIGNEIFCVQRNCTHAFADLSEGFVNEEKKTIRCPLHFSVFSLVDGSVVKGPAIEKLKKFKVFVENDKVYIDI